MDKQIYSAPVHWTLVGQLVREIMNLIPNNWIDDWYHGSAASEVIFLKCFALKWKQERVYWRSCCRRKSFWATLQLINDGRYKRTGTFWTFRSILENTKIYVFLKDAIFQLSCYLFGLLCFYNYKLIINAIWVSFCI